MSSFSSTTMKLSRAMNLVGGVVLVLMMMLTVSDVVVRIFWKPILGTYEMVALAGALVIGFAIPKTSLDDAHVYVDFVVTGGSPKVRKVFRIITKFLGFVLFALLAINLILKGGELYRAQEVTLTVHVPLFPFAYAMGLCCIVECVVLLLQMFETAREGRQQ
jgi:TRAP-type C4-dicarboxylate transport system permease small subunit